MKGEKAGPEVPSMKRICTAWRGLRRCAWGAAVVTVFPLLIAGVSGCGAARPSKYYELTIPADPPAAERSDSIPVTLLLGGFTTTHLYREDRIVYGSGPEELGTYEYQRWAEPPTEMIEDILMRELRASGRFRTVRMRRSNVRGDFVIRGRLYDFKEVTGNPVSARVTLEVEMRDVNTGATVWSHYYTHDEAAREKDVAAIVTALDQNVHQGIKEVVASLDHYFSTHPMK